MQRLAVTLAALLVSFSPAAAGSPDYLSQPWHRECFVRDLPENAGRHKDGQETPSANDDKRPICYTYTEIALQDLVVGVFGILQVPARERLLIVAPWNKLYLPELGYFQIDDGPPIDLIHTCDKQRCAASAESGPILIEQLKNAKGLVLGIGSPQRRNLTVPLQHRGFAEAFEGAPDHDGTDQFANEMRKEIVRMLKETVRTLAE